MADSDKECDIHPGTVTPKKLPKQSGGGGHEFVTALPAIGEVGVEYILLDDIKDCDTYRGTFAWSDGCKRYIKTSGGAGAGAVAQDQYIFEATATGWTAKRNNTVIFTYVDKNKDTIDTYEDTTTGFKVTRDGVVIFEHTDKNNGGGVVIQKVEDIKVDGVSVLDNTTKIANINLSNKVDKIVGKGLSTNDFTNELKTKLESVSNNANKNVQADWNEADTDSDAFIKNKPTIPAGSVLYTTTGTHTDGAIDQKTTTDELNKKVDKEAGKTLTSNDFTTELKDKLTAIEASAQVNKIEEIKTADGVALAITNKSVTLPATTATAPAVDAYTKTQSDDKYVAKEVGKTLTSNDFTDELKTKLEGVANNANKNVQADWDEADTDSDAFIKNKPVIPAGSVLYDVTGTHTDGSITQKVITEELNKKVDKVDGKGLSTNDFTNELKDKLNAVNENGEANVLNGVKTADGNELTIADKKVTLPNFALKSDIASVYKVKGSKANKTELDDIVDKEVGDVYNLADTGVNYVWTGTEWDSLSGNVDLTGYYTKTQADDKFVIKEAGKGLSTNDLTSELKAKIENAKNGGVYLSTTPLEQTIGQSKVIAVGNVVGLTADKVVENGTLIYDNNNGIGVVEKAAGNAVKVKTISLGSITQKAITEELNKKVDKVAGKGLSTNDYTTGEKTKLVSIEPDAQVNKIEEIQTHDGTPLTITDKKVKLPELTADAYTKAQADGKFVAKETGKGLSTNDLTNELKAKIENAKSEGVYLSAVRLEETVGQTKTISITNIANLIADKIVVDGTLVYDNHNGIGVITSVSGNNVVVKTINHGSITTTQNEIHLTYAQDFYSQHEQTVGFYMGKPLYQITIPKLFPSKPSGTQEVGTIHGLERVVEVDGVVMNAGSQVSYLVSHNEMGGTKFINVTGDSASGKISISVGSAMPNGPYLVELTIKYTKKTDAAKNENATPINQALISRPDLWTVGKSYAFGNGLVGVRFSGTVTAGGKVALTVPASFGSSTTSSTNVKKIYNSFVTVKTEKNGVTENHPAGYYGANDFITPLYSSRVDSNNLAFETSPNYVGKGFDAWVLFSSTD